ncbi:MAG: RagB/SusD family nutrient uptake outer membrane protein [Bacteroides cellulosilyticus]|nr:RagB/SusD family nutrient uptake outer membrane protein [Bacteroides cellulosilyticus]
MKTLNKSIIKSLVALTFISGATSCDDFLNREPMSKVAPEVYFTEASQLAAYADRMYADILPSHSNWSYGIFGEDNGTDNQVDKTINDRYTDDKWKVAAADGDWNFEQVYRCNYFLTEVSARYGEDLNGSQNTINGDLNDIKHYIGEVYFLRASEYFKKLKAFGDYPIITEPMADEMEVLREATQRSPRNEVARFILSDLDKAYTLLSAKNMATTRINKDVALLLKSRVALFEGTWLKYFKGTAFVPAGESWPGASKDYNAGYQYPEGGIDNEISYMLEQAMEASEIVAEAYKNKLTENTGILQQSADEPVNPYFDMFAQEDLSKISEVLLWRQYARGLVTHNVNVAAILGNNKVGVTRGFVNNFLMADGTPVYTHGSYADGDDYYKGDITLAAVRENRDPRLSIFLIEPGQKNILYEVGHSEGTMAEQEAEIPDFEDRVSTGYTLRKGGSFNQKYYANGGGYTGAVCYRATEALLNYMEASYEKEGTLNSKAREYWKIIRERSQVDTDFEKTIRLTDMNEEAKNDWSAYSAGNLIDPILYNIRRERRCEFIAEGLRYMDLCRWRAMDQLITAPYHVEGIHLWNTPMQEWYYDDKGNLTLLADGSSKAHVSSPGRCEYVRPFERYSKQAGYNGVIWKMAHYLQPIAVKHFQVSAANGADVTTSPIYQNPYWPVVADQPAER